MDWIKNRKVKMILKKWWEFTCLDIILIFITESTTNHFGKCSGNKS